MIHFIVAPSSLRSSATGAAPHSALRRRPPSSDVHLFPVSSIPTPNSLNANADSGDDQQPDPFPLPNDLPSSPPAHEWTKFLDSLADDPSLNLNAGALDNDPNAGGAGNITLGAPASPARSSAKRSVQVTAPATPAPSTSAPAHDKNKDPRRGPVYRRSRHAQRRQRKHQPSARSRVRKRALTLTDDHCFGGVAKSAFRPVSSTLTPATSAPTFSATASAPQITLSGGDYVEHLQQLQKLRKTADRNRYLTNRNRVLVRKIKDTADQLADAEAELASAKKEHAEHEEAQDESIRNLEKALQKKAFENDVLTHNLEREYARQDIFDDTPPASPSGCRSPSPSI